MRKALVASIGVHVLAFGLSRRVTVAPAEAAPVLAQPQDRWTGSTPELPGAAAGAPGALYEVATEAVPPSEAAETPAPAPPAAPAPVAVKAPVEKAKPSPEPRPQARATATAPVSAPAARRAGRPARPPGAAEGPASGGSGESFGAVGAPSVRDFGKALARAIPMANQVDAIWTSAPLGDVGKLDVAITLDATGHITSAEPRGAEPPATLVSLLRHTLPLLQAGTFALREGASGEGTAIVELRAVVTSAPPPELAGKPNELAHEYAHGSGTAWVKHASGRWITVTLRMRKAK